MIDSVREDLVVSRDQVKQSEAARVELQEVIRRLSEQVKDDSANHLKFQEYQVSENKKLQEELERVKADKLKLENEVGQKDLTLRILTERNLSLSSEVLQHKAELERRKDVDSQLYTANEIIFKITESKQRV